MQFHTADPDIRVSLATGDPNPAALRPAAGRGTMIAVGLILVLAGLLRFHNIGAAALWWDEGFSHRWAVAPVSQMLRETAKEDFNPPLFYALLHGWTRVFGDSEAAMRAPSAIASIISVGLTWLIARRLIREREAVIATLLMAISVYQIHYAKEARSYGLFMAVSLAATLFLLRILQAWRWSDAAAYIFFTAAMFYTHVYAIFFMAAQLIVIASICIAKNPRPFTIRRIVIVGGVLGVALVPWAMFVFARAQVARTAFWIDPPTLRFVARGFERQTGSLAAFLAVFFLVSLAAIQLVKRNRKLPADSVDSLCYFTRFEAIAVLLTLMLVPHVLAIILSDLTQPTYIHRYAIGTMPAMFMLAAIGTSFINRRPVILVLTCALMAVMLRDVVRGFRREPNVKARTMTAYIDQQAVPSDLLVFDGPCGGGANTFDYYSRRPELQHAYLDWSFAQLDTKFFDRLREETAKSNTFWLIMLDRPQKMSAVREQLAETYKMDERFPREAALDQMVAVKFERLAR